MLLKWNLYGTPHPQEQHLASRLQFKAKIVFYTEKRLVVIVEFDSDAELVKGVIEDYFQSRNVKAIQDIEG